MKSIILLGKSNASLSMILEILSNNFKDNKDKENLKILIIKNMNDTTNLPFEIKDIDISEKFDTELENFNFDSNSNSNSNSNQNSSYFIGAFRTGAKLSIFKYFNEKYNLDTILFNFINIISKNSYIASTVNIGSGCLISHMCVIDSYATISNFVTINRCSSIGHHTFIGEFTTINPNTHIAGNCIIGKNVQIGMSVTIFDGITIGNNSIIGAGSLVNKNVPDNVLVYGSPAQIIKNL